MEHKMKKTLAIILTLLMAGLMMVPAMAEAVPSKTTGDMTTVTVERTTGVTPAADFVVEVVEKPALVTTITAALSAAATAVDYFGADAKAAVEAAMPGADVSKIVVNEIVPVKVVAYNESYRDVKAIFTFATEYAAGASVTAMVGIVNGANVTWYAQEAEVVNGAVSVTFTADVLKLMGQYESVVAILS